MNRPSLSFIVPIKDRLDCLRQCVDSILAQTRGDWECLLVDDGSGAETLAYQRDLAARDPRFRGVARPADRKGGSVCRNAGLKEATAPWVVFLDSDDMVQPHLVAERVVLAEQVPAGSVLVRNAVCFSQAPGDIGTFFNVQTQDEPLDRFLSLDVPWQTAGPTWPRELILKRGGFDDTLPIWQDWDLHVRALAEGVEFHPHPGCDFWFRIAHPGKITNRLFTDPVNLEAGLRLMTRIEDLIRSGPRAGTRKLGNLATIRENMLMRMAELHGSNAASRLVAATPASQQPSLRRRLLLDRLARLLPGRLRRRVQRTLWGAAFGPALGDKFIYKVKAPAWAFGPVST